MLHADNLGYMHMMSMMKYSVGLCYVHMMEQQQYAL